MKKRVKEKNKTNVRKMPLLVLVGIIFLLIGILQVEQYVPVYEQIGEMTIYFLWIYLFIAVFSFLSKKADRIGYKHLIPVEKKVKQKRIVKIILEVLFVIVEMYFIISLGLSSFTYNLKLISLQDVTYDFATVGILAGVAVVSFIYKNYISTKKEASANKTATSIFFVIGVVAVIFTVLCVVSIVLEMNFKNIIFWIYRIITIYVAVLFALNLFIKVIKKETLTNFDYEIALPKISFKGKNGEEKKGIIEIIEENTGISLKSLWSLKYVAEILPAAVIGVLVILLVSSCVYKVEPYESAAVYRLGSLNESSIKSEGLHFKLPWPVEKVEIYEVSRVKNMTIGYESNETMDNMWTESHSVEEYKLLTGDGNELVSVNIKLVYKINDLYTYLTKSSNPEALLSSKAYEFMMNKTNSTDLDTILSVDRMDLSNNLHKALNQYTKENNIGLTVEEVVIESIHPPVELADVYQSVVSADVKKTTLITNAQAEAGTLLADAEKDSKTVVIAANEKQTTKVADATQEMAVYKAALEAYKDNPKAFKLSKYLDTYEKVIAGNKVYVFSANVDSDLSKYIISSTGANAENVAVIESEE